MSALTYSPSSSVIIRAPPVPTKLDTEGLSNNVAQWQWAAGTGTDSRPNRMYNPVVQSRRHDPTGAYVRTYVPELAHLDDRAIHAPWETDDPQVRAAGYPAPIVAHAEARERFLLARGAVPGP